MTPFVLPKRLLIDASLYKEHNCPRKVANTLLHGYREKEKSPSIEYGTAFHKFIAEWHTTGDKEKGILLAMQHYSSPDIQQNILEKDFKTLGHLAISCSQYALKYPWQNDAFQLLKDKSGKGITEARFIFPYRVIPELDNLEICLAGTIDALATYYNETCFCDHKTTALWDKTKFFKGFLNSPQLKMYKLINGKLADSYPDTYGRFKNAGGFINGVFISAKGVEFARSEIFNYEDWVMEEFEFMLNKFIDELVGYIKLGMFPRNDTMCDASPYGRCKFFGACSAIDKETEVEILERDFVKSEYDPMKFGE